MTVLSVCADPVPQEIFAGSGMHVIPNHLLCILNDITLLV
jgi:hypothetical protein